MRRTSRAGQCSLGLTLNEREPGFDVRRFPKSPTTLSSLLQPPRGELAFDANWALSLKRRRSISARRSPERGLFALSAASVSPRSKRQRGPVRWRRATLFDARATSSGHVPPHFRGMLELGGESGRRGQVRDLHPAGTCQDSTFSTVKSREGTYAGGNDSREVSTRSLYLDGCSSRNRRGQPPAR